MPYSDNTSNSSLGCHSRLSLPSDSNKVNINSSSKVNHPSTAKILLSKSLKVDLEKLPTVMTSMVTSKHHPSLMFKRSESSSVSCNLKANGRKRYATALSNNQRTGNKKCPRFVSADQRKSSLNKTIPGSKELLLHPNLFNSFRITKPKSNIKCDSSNSTANKCNNESKSKKSNGIHFETKSFYKFSDSCTTNSLAVNKQSDLIPSTSVPSSTVFSNKTDSNNDRVSSKLNFLNPKKDSEQHEPYSNSSEGSHIDLVTGSQPYQESGDQSCHSEAVNPDNAVFALPNPKKIRFPAVPNSSAIQCKWEGCGECFKNHGNLSDHIKVTIFVRFKTTNSIEFAGFSWN